MRTFILGSVAVFCMLIQTAQADSVSGNSGINKFVECSRQCMAENAKCKKERESKCKKDDENCLEACDIAYPDCMAKCPRPGS